MYTPIFTRTKFSQVFIETRNRETLKLKVMFKVDSTKTCSADIKLNSLYILCRFEFVFKFISRTWNFYGVESKYMCIHTNFGVVLYCGHIYTDFWITWGLIS